MRITLFLAVSMFAALLPRAAWAQAPDCRVLLSAANTAEHPAEIVVATSAPTTLTVHCSGTAQPTYRWSTGQTSSTIIVAAPTSAGSSQGYSVEVTQGGATRTLTALVRTAAPGAPACSLTRVPSGDVPAFTNVRITASCINATTFTWTGGYDLRGQGTNAVTHVNIVNAAATIPIDVVAVNENGPGVTTGISIRYVVAPPSCRIVADPPGRVAAGASVRLTGECDGSPGATMRASARSKVPRLGRWSAVCASRCERSNRRSISADPPPPKRWQWEQLTCRYDRARRSTSPAVSYGLTSLFSGRGAEEGNRFIARRRSSWSPPGRSSCGPL